MTEPQRALTTGFFRLSRGPLGKRKNTNGTDGLTLRIEWWPVVAAAAEEEVVVSLFVEGVVGIPAPSRPSFQEEVRASRAAAAWLRWPLPKLVARRLPPPLNMVENMSRMPEIKSQSRSNQYIISIPIKHEKKKSCICNTYERDSRKSFKSNCKREKKTKKKTTGMSATAAVWKRELNSKHIWPFSLSVRNDWDGYNCVCNPICIEYHATSSFLSHSHTHTHGIPFLLMNLIHHNFWFIVFLGGFCLSVVIICAEKSSSTLMSWL